MLNAEILLQRAGNFTASENHRLMAGWDAKEPFKNFDDFDALYPILKPLERKPLVAELGSLTGVKYSGKSINDTWAYLNYEKPSQGLITCAQEKAIEELFEPDPSLNFSTVHTANGEEREADCMMLLAEKTGLNFVHTGEEQVHIYTDGVGCTPDGIVLDEIDLAHTGAEVKCKSPLVHAKNLLINNNDDLKEQAFDHFVQIQTAMLVTGANHWYFANYNPYAKKSAHRFKYIVIDRDEDFIKILNSRIDIAKKIKSDFLLNFQDEKTQTIEKKSKLVMEI